jgi:hypothetical protein
VAGVSNQLFWRAMAAEARTDVPAAFVFAVNPLSPFDRSTIMYKKPEIVKFGTLRELTQIGLDSDCDGGVFGISATDGSWIGCTRTS